MRPLFLILLGLLFGMSGCNSYFNPQDKNSSEKPAVKLNESGDTVLQNYNEKGILVSEVTVKNNKMNGVAFNYYDNGVIQNEINYKDGVKHGRATWNYENGALFRETDYIDGEISGFQKKYYEDGKLMAEIPYRKGQVIPGTVEYNKEGKKKNLPEIKVEMIDNVAFDSKYILRISLSKKQADTKFYQVLETTSGVDLQVPLKLQGNYAEITWTVPPGTYVMEKVRIMAEYNTILGSPVVLEKSVNVAVENR